MPSSEPTVQWAHPTESSGVVRRDQPGTVGLIACSKRKLDIGAPARELYQGDLFKKARTYVERECDSWLILSGLWHVLQPADHVEPYELYLPESGAEWRKCWASTVTAQLELLLHPDDQIVCLASEPYRGWVPKSPWPVETPLAGMGLGYQLGWLSDANARLDSVIE